MKNNKTDILAALLQKGGCTIRSQLHTRPERQIMVITGDRQYVENQLHTY